MAEDAGILVEWALFGAPRLGPSGQFAAIRDLEGMDSRLGLEFQALVVDIADWYKVEIGRRFAEKHGRTGETEASIHGQQMDVTGDMYQYAVQIGGHIGAVISPLPAHNIPAFGKTFYNADPAAPREGRVTNFYGEFGPVAPNVSIAWYQGGSESYSPDKSWYEDAQADLELQGQSRLNMLGGIIQQQWALNSGETVWSRGQAKLNIARYRSQAE